MTAPHAPTPHDADALPDGIPSWRDLAPWCAAAVAVAIVLSALFPWGFAPH